MADQYRIRCDCGTVRVTLSGEPRVRGYCHCEDCRALLKIPYHSVTAWDKEQVTLDDGASAPVAYQHPEKRMQRFYCADCGETMFNSNAKDWRVVSQFLIRKCYDGELPHSLQPKGHFFYAQRIVDIDDDLPRRE